MDILSYATSRMMLELPQERDESEQEYLGFLTWVRAGTPTYAELAELTGKTGWTEVARDRRWIERLDESAYGVRAKLLTKRLANKIAWAAEGRSASANIVSLIQSQVTKLLVTDAETDIQTVDLDTLARTLDSVHKYERLEADQSTENLAVQTTSPNLEGLSVEELRLLRKVLPEVFDADVD
jgi:hypothetical protein